MFKDKEYYKRKFKEALCAMLYGALWNAFWIVLIYLDGIGVF